jgi:glycosyltransferase involved in cell wall biosynthesis
MEDLKKVAMLLNKIVSVIVPIYKVEKYLTRCIESILKQTYKFLEIILVDDGSPDRCGNIAEEFAKSDDRIKVFHKENGGLSDARNYGMKFAKGDYTIFVDSDDWLAENMVEQLMAASVKYQAEVVQSAYYYAYDEYLLFDHRYYSMESPPVVLKQTLMYELVKNERVKNFAWGKLYKTSLIKNIPFKKGVLFEDVFWAHKVMDKVDTYVLINQPLYYYFQRSDSIVASYSLKNLDIIKGLKERHEFIVKNYQHLTDDSLKTLLEANLIHYHLLLRNKKKDKGGESRREIQHFLNKDYQKFKKAVSKDQSLKKQLLLFRIHPYFNVLFLLFQKILRKSKLISQPAGLERVEYRSITEQS